MQQRTRSVLGWIPTQSVRNDQLSAAFALSPSNHRIQAPRNPKIVNRFSVGALGSVALKRQQTLERQGFTADHLHPLSGHLGVPAHHALGLHLKLAGDGPTILLELELQHEITAVE